MQLPFKIEIRCNRPIKVYDDGRLGVASPDEQMLWDALQVALERVAKLPIVEPLPAVDLPRKAVRK